MWYTGIWRIKNKKKKAAQMFLDNIRLSSQQEGIKKSQN